MGKLHPLTILHNRLLSYHDDLVRYMDTLLDAEDEKLSQDVANTYIYICNALSSIPLEHQIESELHRGLVNEVKRTLKENEDAKANAS